MIDCAENGGRPAGTTNYTWDYENRLTQVTLPASGGTVSFTYDPLGRRVRKVAPSATTVFAYDGANIIEETDSSGTAVARYAQGLNIDEPLAMLRSSATNFYSADGLGSITSLTDGAGATAASYTYDTFGNLAASTGSVTNPFRYTAREWDNEPALSYNRARYFDPTTGRFLAEDPIRAPWHMTLYGYTHNRPTGYVDSFGLQEAWNQHRRVGNVFTLFRLRLLANRALDDATEWARQRQLPPNSLHNGPADAFRHCYWSCGMTREFGERIAETVGDEHENEGRRNGQSVREELMDRANNQAGRLAALKCENKGRNCWDLCTELYDRGRLYGLGAFPSGFRPTIGPRQ